MPDEELQILLDQNIPMPVAEWLRKRRPGCPDSSEYTDSASKTQK